MAESRASVPVGPDVDGDDISPRTYVVALAVTALVAALLRCAFPLADSPWYAPVGIVWHDEGAWLHNARNMALFGQWQLDQWNPMYLTPVFTWFEYVSFRLFGVGLWQARLVSEAFGLATVLCLAGAVRSVANRRAGLTAGILLATNFIWVMWSRAAILETLMVSFMVFSAAAYVRAHRTGNWWWGLAAGACALLSFFTKAAAAFFLGALLLEAFVSAWLERPGRWHSIRWTSAGVATLAGLLLAGAVALAFFVVPNWQEVRFYNWQMSVTRKPTYTLRTFMDRASWLPIIHDFFTQAWLLLLLAVAGLVGLVRRWREASPLERLSALWIIVGCAEMVVHDTGNERRFVFLIPPMVVFAALVAARDRRLLPEGLCAIHRRAALLGAPLVLGCLYVLVGSAARVAFVPDIARGDLSTVVRLSALASLGVTVMIYATWPAPAKLFGRTRWSWAAAATLVGVMAAGDLALFSQFATHRTYANYDAMVEVGRILPPDTLVQGKLANGMALESRIRPVFVGTGFGNYDDRLKRPEIRYALTYTRPWLAYEGRILLDVLNARRWRIIHRFPVVESLSGDDEAVLVEFLPDGGR